MTRDAARCVARGFAARPLPDILPAASGVLQRKCACGNHAPVHGECRECAARREVLQRRPVGRSPTLDVAPDVRGALRSPGQALDPATRSFMEARFGRDFSQVRIHADERASASAQAVDARAYTVGSDIVFAPGEYRPHELGGRRLLAHELAHSLQQGQVSRPTAEASLELGPADASLEREADRAAEHVATGSSRESVGQLGEFLSPLLSRSQPMLQREERTKPPLIPIPVFDELDPMIIVPDIPGVPSVLRGRQVKLSTLRSALDVLRGNLPSLGAPGQDFCQRLLPGYETAHGGDVDGMCCPQFVRERGRCCDPRNIGLMSFRCCTSEEVIINDRCVRPERAPTPAPSLQGPTLPTIPRLELRFPHIPFGTIESSTLDHFELNSAAIPSGGAAVLDRLASQLQLYRDAEVHVEGHADSSYTEEYNQRLSERRAKAVRNALTRRGVDSKRIITQGFGETRLLFPSESNSEEKARNRRVEIWFYIPPSSREPGEAFRLRRPTVSASEEAAP